MTLLDARVPKPQTGLRKYVPIPVLIAIVVIIAVIIIHEFRNYPEERAVDRFLTTLEQGNYQEAYRLWQPSSSYSFDDFMSGWGEKGDYGKVRSFHIIGAKSKGPKEVVVTVSINHVDPPAQLLVDRKTKGLAYSPY